MFIKFQIFPPQRELYAVLRSHEYHALSSTIDTLYKPLHHGQGIQPVADPRQDNPHNPHNSEYLPGAPQPVQLIRQTHGVDPSSFIPVTPTQDGSEGVANGNVQSNVATKCTVSGKCSVVN